MLIFNFCKDSLKTSFFFFFLTTFFIKSVFTGQKTSVVNADFRVTYELLNAYYIIHCYWRLILQFIYYKRVISISNICTDYVLKIIIITVYFKNSNAAELKFELNKRGLSSHGIKPELSKRWNEVIEGNSNWEKNGKNNVW